MATPPSPTPATRGLLTTGLVGGWLAGSAFGLILLVFLVTGVASVAGRTNAFDSFAMSAGVVAFLSLLLWVGGMVCCIIGWFGLAALYRPAIVVAWLGIATMVLALVTPIQAPFIRSCDGLRMFISFAVLVLMGFYAAQIFVWMRTGAARGAARLTMVGSALVVASALFGLVMMWAVPEEPSLLYIIAAYAAPTGGLLAHLGSGLAMARERATVKALQSFD